MSSVAEIRNYLRDKLNDSGADASSEPWFDVKALLDVPGVLIATDQDGTQFQISIDRLSDETVLEPPA